MRTLLSLLVLVGSGIAAGVLFSVALSVVPAFLALAPDRYVEVHKLIGRRYDRVMPAVVLASFVIDGVLAALPSPAVARILFGAAALLTIGVSLVSQFGNVPINRAVKRLDGPGVPTGWSDPRRRWRALHLVRTWLAVLALIITAAAVLSGR